MDFTKYLAIKNYPVGANPIFYLFLMFAIVCLFSIVAQMITKKINLKPMIIYSLSATVLSFGAVSTKFIGMMASLLVDKKIEDAAKVTMITEKSDIFTEYGVAIFVIIPIAIAILLIILIIRKGFNHAD